MWTTLLQGRCDSKSALGTNDAIGNCHSNSLPPAVLTPIARSMNRRHFIQALGTISLLRLQAQNVDEGWRPLFDGGTLKGWKATARSPHSKVSGHTTAGHWRVEGAVLVGSQDTPGNGGLILTEEEFGDFEVVLEMNNDFGPDSGLFLRCTEEGKAYQCLIDYYEGGTIGGILGEGIWNRRGVRNYSFGRSPALISLNENKEHPCPVRPDSWRSFWRAGEWNEIRARITGVPPTITTWVTGVEMLRHTEPASIHPAKGHIGLQIHGGLASAKGCVRYRNIRVRTL